jgi:2-C-methyl-D-erythritol 4-phosphate cytidylyltransferase
MKVYSIIPSGGIGKRINTPLPKQYIKFHDKELIAYTLEVFQQSNLVNEIIVASQKEYFDLIEEIKKRFGFSKLTSIIEGGKERQDSVFNAVKSIHADKDDIVLVHDAARPMLSPAILEESINTAIKFGAAVVAIKAKDTLFKGNDSVANYVDRNEFYYAQTPQVFKYEILFNAMQKANTEKFVGTDESMLVYRTGYAVKIVKGSSLNFKVTTEDDLKLFEKFYDNKSVNYVKL